MSREAFNLIGSSRFHTGSKNPTACVRLANLIADLPSSSGMYRRIGVYVTTLDLWRKELEGFNLEPPATIPSAVPEEVGTHTKGLT